MTAGGIAEVAGAVVLIGGGLWLYRRRVPDDGSYGSQGAVILFIIAAILLIHGLGLMDYRPSPAELGQ